MPPLLLFIAAVSLNDIYWSIKTRDSLYEFEANPVGRWLIKLDGGDVALFMTVKVVGTMLVLAVLPLLYRHRSTWGAAAGIGVACFQAWLLLHLNGVAPAAFLAMLG